MRASAGAPQIHQSKNFILGWNRTVPESRIRQFFQVWNRTPKQLTDITATWKLKRGWNHGSTPNSSMYTKRILEEALWLRPQFPWSLQEVVDIVIAFCKRNQVTWSCGRAKKQIADEQQRILDTSHRPELYRSSDFVSAFACNTSNTHIPLTCNGVETISVEKCIFQPPLSTSIRTILPSDECAKLPDTLPDAITADASSKVYGGFKRNSAPRDAILQTIGKYGG